MKGDIDMKIEEKRMNGQQETLAERLKILSQTDIRTVDRSILVDRKNVKLVSRLSRNERMRSYIEQVKNPYCYLDDGVVVKISFMDTEVTLEDRLEEYVRNL